MKEHAIVWFRQDLRIADNPALAAAAKCGLPVIALFIHAPNEEAPWAPGAASNWWLYHALSELDEELEKQGLRLTVRQGPSLDALLSLVEDYTVRQVFWNRRYEPAVIERDTGIKKQLRDRGVEVRTFNSALLYEPHEISNQAGKPFRVFTPFWKHLYGQPRRPPVAVDSRSLQAPEIKPDGVALEDLGLMPEISWDTGFYEYWKPGLEDARAALGEFANERVHRYRKKRDIPGVTGTSRLSPYLHFGQLGPRQVWDAVKTAGAEDSDGGFTFLSEIAWREFAYHLLYHFPDTPGQALNGKFRDFPWEPDDAYLKAWQQGMTGYPVVDAGMRQLWHTGWMHNRVRMITASFLVKHLLQPWQEGARWFWDTLVDADLASNTMGWQWTAGCGADAAPYFRVFNPILQGEKFDADGQYVRAWVPELAPLPDRYIHQPWAAPADALGKAGVRLGDDYPRPIIDHKAGRERALAALSSNKQKSG
jgi:deoxyribodipyrimidine photo-lyase